MIIKLQRFASCGAIYAFFAFLLTACGGSGGGSTGPDTSPVSVEPDLNSPPSIFGTPPVKVAQLESYAFSPAANDPDQDSLSFSIRNRPRWAQFDSLNGSLTGIPSKIDAGTTVGIMITVSDGIASASLPPFDLTVAAADSAGTVIVSATNPDRYVWAVLVDDALVYIDKEYKFVSVPEPYRGLKYLRTEDNDKFVAAADAISFTVDQPVSVLVAFDPQFSAVPTWLDSWTDRGARLTSSHLVFDVYRKDFAAGRVILGGNEFGGSMYSVIVAAAGQLDIPTLPAEPPPEQPPEQNLPPRIGGAPTTRVDSGSNYNFQPIVDDSDSDALTFSIANRPAWASFDSQSGTLSGRPDAANVGTYSNIQIRVSDGQDDASLDPFTIEVVGAVLTGSATLSWTAPTQNADGTPLTDLNGYDVHYSTTLGSYPNSDRIDNPGITTHVVENLTAGTWFFVVTARDASGNQSQQSSAASKTISPP